MNPGQDSSFCDYFQRPQPQNKTDEMYDDHLEFKTLNKELYVKVSTLVDSQNPIQKCVQELQKYKSQKQWSKEDREKFAIIAQSIGIRQVSPKQIIFCLKSSKYTKQNIGSRLQKYRLQICQEYNITRTQQIENWMFPSKYQSLVLRQIIDKWRDKEFEGFSVNEIQQFLQ